jgi:hypothetical protein
VASDSGSVTLLNSRARSSQHARVIPRGSKTPRTNTLSGAPASFLIAHSAHTAYSCCGVKYIYGSIFLSPFHEGRGRIRSCSWGRVRRSRRAVLMRKRQPARAVREALGSPSAGMKDPLPQWAGRGLNRAGKSRSRRSFNSPPRRVPSAPRRLRGCREKGFSSPEARPPRPKSPLVSRSRKKRAAYSRRSAARRLPLVREAAGRPVAP